MQRPASAAASDNASAKAELLTLYRAMYASRACDRLEAQLASRGEAFFYLEAAGHESIAALGLHMLGADWLHCHYRDKALLAARGLTLADYFHSILGTDEAASRGRRLGCMLSAPAHNILSIPTPVGNGALQAVGIAAAVKDRPESPIAYCGLGDGTTQQGEVLEALGEAVRTRLPVLFVVQNNRLAISTSTHGKTFFSLPGGDAESYLGEPLVRLDGRDPAGCLRGFGEVVARMRETRAPGLVILDVERLGSHTSSDDQRAYRDEDEIAAARERGDPVARLRADLLATGLDEAELAAQETEVETAVQEGYEAAAAAEAPAPCRVAKPDLPEGVTTRAEYRGDPEKAELTMIEALREVLRARLESDERVSLYGEDLEDPKGDVFGVTRGLSTQFPSRVRNSPLAESTIVGVSIGRALAGERPVAFLQFADFLPVCYNQIAAELGSLWWRSGGGWKAPVIVMAACGAYKPGTGPFHTQTGEALASHAPGLDVYMPSDAADAAALLNTAFDTERPAIFLYPKNLLNDRERKTSADVSAHFAPVGKARVTRSGGEITLVGWGNSVRLCERAALALENAGVEPEVIDLRCLSPWDEDLVVASAARTGRLVVVHEDNRSCGLGAEVAATVAERSPRPVQIRRVTRPDTFVPCNYANHVAVLPSRQDVLEAACALLDLDLRWQASPEEAEPDLLTVEALGASPSDESVTLVELLVRPGETVAAGQVLANVEADKAASEMSAPVAGTLEAALAAEGETVKVGAPLFRIRVPDPGAIRRTRALKEPTPLIKRRQREMVAPLITPDTAERVKKRCRVGLAAVAARWGSRVVASEEVAERFPDMSAEDIVRRSGIVRRQCLGENETAQSLAVSAAREALDREGLAPDDLDVIICSTGSSVCATPSMACMILHALCQAKGAAQVQAYDINAACSGYLYALQCAYDHLQSHPAGRILIVTSEALSTRANPDDFSTAILFGDAATASIVYGEERLDGTRALVYRPELSGEGDDGTTLYVPLRAGQGEFIHMDGSKVFSVAVRKMVFMLKRSCAEAGLELADLDLVVSHQANQRIIDAVRNRIKFPPDTMFSNIARFGNTSSSTIPLCLTEVLPDFPGGKNLGMCAFGGGLTFGAGILRTV